MTTPILPKATKINKHLQIQKQIGSGSFSTVYLATHSVLLSKQTSKQFQLALKIIPKAQIDQLNLSSKIQQEISSLKLCRTHDHTVTLYNVLHHDQYIILITDYLQGGELHDHIESKLTQRQPLTKKQSFLFFQQIISALSYLHLTLNIAHRDLKLENILLDGHKTCVKIADFGFSKRIVQGEKMNTACGSPYFAAPELISNVPYDGDKVDIYSVGVILYIMLCGKFPFTMGNGDYDGQKYMFEQIRKGNCSPLPKYLDDDERGILRGMMNVNGCERMDVADVCSSQYYLKKLPNSLKNSNNIDSTKDKKNTDKKKKEEGGKVVTGEEMDKILNDDNDKQNNDDNEYHTREEQIVNFEDDIDREVCYQVHQLFKQSSSTNQNDDNDDNDDNDGCTLTTEVVEKIIYQEMIKDNFDMTRTGRRHHTRSTSSSLDHAVVVDHADDDISSKDDGLNSDADGLDLDSDIVQDVKLVYEICLGEKRRKLKARGTMSGLMQFVSECRRKYLNFSW